MLSTVPHFILANDINELHSIATTLVLEYDKDDFKMSVNDFKFVEQLANSLKNDTLLLELSQKSLFFESCKPALLCLITRTIENDDSELFVEIVFQLGSFHVFPLLMALDSISMDLFEKYMFVLIKTDFKGVFLCLVESNVNGTNLYPLYDMLLAPFKSNISDLNLVINQLSIEFKQSALQLLIQFSIYLSSRIQLSLTSSDFIYKVLKAYPIVNKAYSSLLLQLYNLDSQFDFKKIMDAVKDKKLLLYLVTNDIIDDVVYKSLFPNDYAYFIPILLNKFAIDQDPKLMECIINLLEETIDFNIDFTLFVSQTIKAITLLFYFPQITDICKGLVELCLSLIEELHLCLETSTIKDLDLCCSEFKKSHVSFNVDIKETKEEIEDIVLYLQDTEPAIIAYGLSLISTYNPALMEQLLFLLNHSDSFVILNTIQALIICSDTQLVKLIAQLYKLCTLSQSISWYFNCCELLIKLSTRHGEIVYTTQLLDIPLVILSKVPYKQHKYTSIALSKYELNQLSDTIDNEEETVISQTILRSYCLSILYNYSKHAIHSLYPHLFDLIPQFSNLLLLQSVYHTKPISLILCQLFLSDLSNEALMTLINSKDTQRCFSLLFDLDCQDATIIETIEIIKVQLQSFSTNLSSTLPLHLENLKFQ